MAKRSNYHALLNSVQRTRSGRNAIARFSKFWGVKSIPQIRTLSMPGVGKKMILVSMGRSPGITLADGPKGRAKRIKRLRLRGYEMATDPSGRRIFIISRRSRNTQSKRLRFLGWVKSSEYIPSKAIERLGSHKRGKHWQHEHSDDGGKWPKAYRDSAGNIIYGRGTYRVTDWIRR